LGQQQRRELLHPTSQQLLLLLALRAVGVVAGETLLGQDIQTSKQAQRLFEVEVVDVAASFLAQQFQGQQAEQGGVRRDHV
jgi:hypothetical protein